MLLVCNGMYRSGSTLQHKLVCRLIGARGSNVGFWTSEEVATKHSRLSLMAKDQNIYILKTHSAIPRLPGSVRIIYSHRDLRDVAVSLYSKLECSQEVMLSLLDECVDVYKSNIDSPAGCILVQSYELLTSDLESCVQQLAHFLGIDLSAREMELLAKEYSIDSVSKQVGKESGIRATIVGLNRRFNFGRKLKTAGVPSSWTSYMRRVVQGEGDGSSFHFNHISKHRGRSGVWRDALDSRDAEIINKKYGTWLATKS